MANPWFRFYSEFADDPKVQMLPEIMQRRLVMLFCDQCKGVTVTERHRAFHWRISDVALAETKAVFIENGFIDEDWNVLNWHKRQFISDSSTSRTRRYRERHETSQKRHSDGDVTKCDALDTDTDSDSEESIAEDTSVSSAVHGASADGPGEKTPDELIYAEYPRKEGHRAALKQIQLAVVRLQHGEGDCPAFLPIEARRFLFKQVRAYAHSPAGKNPDRSKIPMPKTWFSQSRYLDDPESWKITQSFTAPQHTRPSEPGYNPDAPEMVFTREQIEQLREKRARGEPISPPLSQLVDRYDREVQMASQSPGVQ